LSASCGGLDHELRPLGEPISTSGSARLSVPDTLEPPDWQHKNTGPAGALLGRTGNPELGLPCKRAQRLDPSGTTSGPGLYKNQNIPHLIIVNADDQGSQTRAAYTRVSLNLRRGRADCSQICQERPRIR